MEATLTAAKFEAAYTGEEILSFCTAYTWKHWHGINEVDRDEVICQMAYGMAEAANRAEAGQNVRAFQWSYAIGYAKKWFELRAEVAKQENVRIDYHHGEDGDGEDEKGNLTMADLMADDTLTESLSPELTEALSGLAPKEREVVILSQVKGYTLDEIAERLEISGGKVAVYRIEQKALDTLRRLLTVKGVAA